MLEKIGTPGFEAISRYSTDVVQVLRMVKTEVKRPVHVAEIGLGIGATTRAILNNLLPDDALDIFDFQDTVDELMSDFPKFRLGKGITINPYGNEKKVHASYSWTLAKILLKKREARQSVEIYDVAYLDGAHTFLYEAAACCLLKEMVKPGGYLILDDVYWSHTKSKVWNPINKPHVRESFTDEQLSTPQVEVVKKAFMDHDPSFTEIFLTDNRKPDRAIFQKGKRA